MLVRHLPQDSATGRATLGQAADWSTTDHLLALVVDLLAGANWQRAGDSNKPRPKPIDRPGGTSRRRLELSGVEMKRRLEDLRERTRG